MTRVSIRRGVIGVLGIAVPLCLVVPLVLVVSAPAWPLWAQNTPAQESPTRESAPKSVPGDPQIAQLQADLRKLGFDIRVVDGLYGPNTRHAIEAFEKAQGLPITGDPGRLVRESVARAVFQQSRRARRLWSQSRLYLRALGYAPGNGSFETEAAQAALTAFTESYRVERTRGFDRTLHDLIRRRARKTPEARRFLCRHYMDSGAYSLALGWCRPAAESGTMSAQYDMGWMAYYGRGRARDLADARAWFAQAAEQGHRDSMVYLGLMYRRGQGGPRDPEAALYWYRRATHEAETRAGAGAPQ